MNEFQVKSLIDAYKALCVINLDSRIRGHLQANDPMAARQVESALQALESSFKNMPVPEGRKPKPPRASVPLLMQAINDFLDANDKALRGDAIVYTREEWRARREEYGNEAVCTLVIDGSPLHDCFNYGSYGWGTLERFQAMLAKLGYYMELGYSWTVHIYPN
jgi:hypothetical protein